MEKITKNTDKNIEPDIKIQQENTDERPEASVEEAIDDVSLQDDEQIADDVPAYVDADVDAQDPDLTDESHQPAPKQKVRKKSKYRFSLSKLITNIILAAIIIGVTFGCVKGFNALREYINSNRPVETKSEVISITSTGTLAYKSFQRGVLVANSGNIAMYNAALECLWEIPGFEGMPVIQTKGKYALVAYTDTTNAVLLTEDSASVPVTCTGRIVSSYVNENGYFALVMTEDGYKNLIAVYDNSGNLVYKWHSAENYITSVALSPDNKNMAAATIGFTENGFDSGIMMFDLAQNNPNAGQHQSDNLIMTVEYVSNNRLVAIGDKTSTFYRKNGKVAGDVDYNSKKLITFDVSDSGRLILCFAKDDSAMSNCDIYSYNSRGGESGHFETEGRVLSVSCCADNILVAKDSEFDLLTERCRRLRSTSVVRDLKNSVLFNGGRDAFVISGNVAQIIRVK